MHFPCLYTPGPPHLGLSLCRHGALRLQLLPHLVPLILQVALRATLLSQY